jgi:hypothetical protein
MALTIECCEFRPVERNSLKGFATIKIKELQLTVKDVALHESHGRMWASLPAKPQIKDGKIITDESGKVQYSPIFEFDNRDVREAFSRAVIVAVGKIEPRLGAAGA